MTDASPLQIRDDPAEPGALILTPRSRPGSLFRLWFPEIVWRQRAGGETAGTHSFQEALQSYAVFDRTESPWKTTPWRKEGRCCTRTLAFPEGSVHAGARLRADGLDLELVVQNRSPHQWLDSYAEVCLQLARAADFADRTRERTYGRIDGAWRMLATTATDQTPARHHSYEATPPSAFYRKSLFGWWTTCFDVRLDHPFLFVRDCADQAVIAIGFDPCAGYGNNLDPDMACIHSDPRFGRLPPGERATARGRILYRERSASTFVAELERAPA